MCPGENSGTSFRMFFTGLLMSDFWTSSPAMTPLQAEVNDRMYSFPSESENFAPPAKTTPAAPAAHSNKAGSQNSKGLR